MQTDPWIIVERQEINLNIYRNLVVIKIAFKINGEKKDHLIMLEQPSEK